MSFPIRTSYSILRSFARKTMSAVRAWAKVATDGAASGAAVIRSETGSGRSSRTASEAATSTFPPRITSTPAFASRLMYCRLLPRCRAYSAWLINLRPSPMNRHPVPHLFETAPDKDVRGLADFPCLCAPPDPSSVAERRCDDPRRTDHLGTRQRLEAGSLRPPAKGRARGLTPLPAEAWQARCPLRGA